MIVPGLRREEEALLVRARERPADALADLGAERLCTITREVGIEEATALLYDRIVRSEPHRAWNARVAKRFAANDREPPELRATLAIVPGAFWREYPHTGVGGEVLAAPARRLGMRVERIPVASQGTPSENARRILVWLRASRAEEIVLASLSKGGADVRAALALPDSAQDFGRVRAWLDLSGIVPGTPMVDWYEARRLRRFLLASVLRLRGIDPRFLRELGLAPRRAPLHTPGMSVVRVAGFPLRRHCTGARGRRWHARLAPLGPNDGVVLLADLASLPGVLLPMWGADHYLRPIVQDTRLVTAVLATLAEDLALARAPARR